MCVAGRYRKTALVLGKAARSACSSPITVGGSSLMPLDATDGLSARPCRGGRVSMVRSGVVPLPLREGLGEGEHPLTDPPPTPPASGRGKTVWQRSLQYLGAAWASLLLLFWRDAADMAAIWWNSSTFNHCLLIVADPRLARAPAQGIAGRTEAAAVDACDMLYGAVGAGGWLLGDAAGLGGGAAAWAYHDAARVGGSFARAERHARPVVPAILHVLPRALSARKAVPALQTLTAKMCMLLLGWTGIPRISTAFLSQRRAAISALPKPVRASNS